MILTRRVRANPTISGVRQHDDGSPVFSDLTITPVDGGPTYRATPDERGYFAINLPVRDTETQWRTKLTPLGRLVNRLTGWPRTVAP